MIRTEMKNRKFSCTFNLNQTLLSSNRHKREKLSNKFSIARSSLSSIINVSDIPKMPRINRSEKPYSYTNILVNAKTDIILNNERSQYRLWNHKCVNAKCPYNDKF